jgi:hypothetical protein
LDPIGSIEIPISPGKTHGSSPKLIDVIGDLRPFFTIHFQQVQRPTLVGIISIPLLSISSYVHMTRTRFGRQQKQPALYLSYFPIDGHVEQCFLLWGKRFDRLFILDIVG